LVPSALPVDAAIAAALSKPQAPLVRLAIPRIAHSVSNSPLLLSTDITHRDLLIPLDPSCKILAICSNGQSPQANALGQTLELLQLGKAQP
jgi:hypothetical protein